MRLPQWLHNPISKGVLGTLIASYTLLSLPSAFAESYQVRSNITVEFTTQADKGIAKLLSEILSAHQANQKAIQYLKGQGLFKDAHVLPEYYPAIALSLASDALSYNSDLHNSNQVIHKVKLSYESTQFPDDIDDYFAKNYYQLVILKRAFEYNKKIARQAIKYLKNMESINNPTYQQIVREQKGKPLSDLLMVNKWATDANYYMQREKYKKAMKLTEKSIKAMPNFVDMYMVKAFIESAEKDYDAAIKSMNFAIKKQPKEALFHLLLGNIYFAQGLLIGESEKSYNKAIELDPTLGWAYFMRAHTKQANSICLASLKDFKKACDLGIKDACKKDSCD